MSVSESNSSVPKKRRVLLKSILIIFGLVILAGIALPLFFSEERIAAIIETEFKTRTGLNLEIGQLDLHISSGKINLNSVISTTSAGREIGRIKQVSLALSISDLYRLYRDGTLHLNYLELDEIHISDIPYLQIVKELAPAEVSSEENMQIARFLDNAEIDIAYLYLRQISPGSIDYKVKCSFAGKYSGGGEATGIVSGLDKADIRKISISANTDAFKYTIHDQSIASEFAGNLEYSDFTVAFSGVLSTNQTPLEIFHARPETKYDGMGRWNIKTNTIDVPEVKITNDDGLMIRARGSITNPTTPENLIISAEISDSLAQIPQIATDDNRLKIGIEKGFKFVGKLYIAPDKLDIRGDASADKITISNNQSAEVSSSITSHLSASLDSLAFDNLSIKSASADISGNILIPNKIFHPESSIYDLKDIELDLNINCDSKSTTEKLLTLGILEKTAIIPHGMVNLKLLTLQTDNDTTVKLSILAENNDTGFNYGGNNDIITGSISGNLTGRISPDNHLAVDELSLKSDSASFSLKANPTDQEGVVNFIYSAQAKVNKLINLCPVKDRTEDLPIESFTIHGSGNLNTLNREFFSEESAIEFHFFTATPPSYFSITGPIKLTAKDNWPLLLDDSVLNVYNTDIITNKDSISCTAALKAEAALFSDDPKNRHLFSPSGKASLGIRSKNSSLAQLIGKLLKKEDQPFAAGSTVLRAKLDFTPETINLIARFTLNDFIISKPVDFTARQLDGTSLLKFDFTENKLTINELKIQSPDKSYEYTGAGKLYLKNEVFESFNSKFTADVNKFFQHFKGYGSAETFDGKVEFLAELVGTSDSPTLTIVGKSNKITMSSQGYENSADNVKFDAKLSWNREKDGKLYGLKAEEIFLQSSNGAAYITGVSERFNLENSGIVDFGKGCNINLHVKGNRKILWPFIPHNIIDTIYTGNNESVSLSASLSAIKLPLFSFETDLRKTYMKQVNIAGGKITIDNLGLKIADIKNVSADFSLKSGIARVENGKADLAGSVTFSSITDLSKVPYGKIRINLSRIDLARALSRLPDQPVLQGVLTLPADAPDSSMELTWKGATKEEILQSLSTRKETAKIDNLIVESINERQDWEKYLSVDFPPAMAKQIAEQIDKKLGPTYGKKKRSSYRYFNLLYQLDKNTIKLLELKCGGGNTSDLIVKGLVSYTGKLKLRIYPVGNIQKSFDSRALLDIPTVQSYTATLDNKSKEEFYRVIPTTLEQLAREKKLFIDVTGNVKEPIIDIEGLRAEIRKNIPAITQRFNRIIGEGGILKLILKDVKSDKLRKALGAEGNSSLQSGSSFGDLLKLME